MSLDDRDWYRTELARKRGHNGPRSIDRALLELLITLAVIVAVTPLLMTPRATYGESWQVLIERVMGNMNCSRTEGGVTVVSGRPCQ